MASQSAKRTILFVTPPYHCGVVEVAGSWPPLGLLFLAQQALEVGWNAEVYDAMTLRHDFDDIRRELGRRSFDVLATTAITPTFPDANELCRLAKVVRPNCTTLLGGVHPTFCFNEILSPEKSPVDYIIGGEGELPLRHYLSHFEDLAARHATPNLFWRNDGKVRVNPFLPLNDDLDSLEAAWHLLDWNTYRYHVIPQSRLGAVSTSRGCNHGCTFCSQQKFWNKIWRGRSPESVVREMRRLHVDHGINVFLFTDEYPTYDRDRWERLLDLIIEARLDSYILIETRVEDIVRDEDILPKYRRAGIIHVYVGAEATDQATLDRINKEISLSDSRRAIELIARHGMISETSFVLGFPEETPESIERTFQLAREFNPDFAHFLAITPWPYSDLFREMDPYIETRDFRLYNLVEPVIKPRAMSRREVDRAIIDCYARFYMGKFREYSTQSDPFRREYLMTSTKLIMHSSFLIKKLARLGLSPSALMKGIAEF
ncbi:MAG: radical SAM protein [candidate division Zixibacteria bacterium]|nr:radical SAM protein [candidate division Zixibacteria bacterium]